MFNAIAIVFLFFVVIVITAALFFCWVVVSIVKLAMGGFKKMACSQKRPALAMSTNMDTVRCSRPRCKAPNPRTARFCRRCGDQLPSAQQVAVRRAAVW